MNTFQKLKNFKENLPKNYELANRIYILIRVTDNNVIQDNTLKLGNLAPFIADYIQKIENDNLALLCDELEFEDSHLEDTRSDREFFINTALENIIINLYNYA